MNPGTLSICGTGRKAPADHYFQFQFFLKMNTLQFSKVTFIQCNLDSVTLPVLVQLSGYSYAKQVNGIKITKQLLSFILSLPVADLKFLKIGIIFLPISYKKCINAQIKNHLHSYTEMSSEFTLLNRIYMLQHINNERIDNRHERARFLGLFPLATFYPYLLQIFLDFQVTSSKLKA